MTSMTEFPLLSSWMRHPKRNEDTGQDLHIGGRDGLCTCADGHQGQAAEESCAHGGRDEERCGAHCPSHIFSSNYIPCHVTLSLSFLFSR